MAAPTNAANVKKVLANSEPSTHGTSGHRRVALHMSAFGPKRTSCGVCRFLTRRPMPRSAYRLRCCPEAVGRHMQRREFIRLLGGAAVAWPLAARAQQSDRVRRIGVLVAATADDAELSGAAIAAFQQGLQQLGWSDGRNVHIDIRWAADQRSTTCREHAAELAALAPDVILAVRQPECGGVVAGNPHRPNRVRACRRSSRLRLREEPGQTGRQRYWLYAVRVQFEREMAGAAQGARAGRNASSDPPGRRLTPAGSVNSLP